MAGVTWSRNVTGALPLEDVLLVPDRKQVVIEAYSVYEAGLASQSELVVLRGHCYLV